MTTVFGGSPRHHSRNVAAIQQSTPILSTVAANQSNQISFPIQSYISSSTPTSSQQYHHYRHRSHGNGPPTQTLGHHHSQSHRSRHHKRKSAVELLAESKPFYVKTDVVMAERHSSSSYRRHPPTSSCTVSPQSRTPLSGHHQSHHSSRRCSSSSTDLLQNKLRNLLNASADGKGSAMSATAQDISPKYDISKYMSPKKLNKQVIKMAFTTGMIVLLECNQVF